MTPDPRVRRTRKDLGPNWVRREMPVELDILAADNEPSHSAHPGFSGSAGGAHPGYAAGPHSLPPLDTREQGWGKGIRPGRLTLASRLPAPSAEDSLPVIPDSDEELARLPAGHRAFLDQVREDSRQQEVRAVAVAVVMDSSSGDEADEVDADEQSTNLYEPMEGEDPSVADMLSTDNQAIESGVSGRGRVPLRAIQSGPRAGPLVSGQSSSDARSSVSRLAVVRSVSDSIEGEYAGLRATPPAAEPRPLVSSGLDWPPPMERPGIDYPEDWLSDEIGGTLIVIDPARPQLGLLGSSRLGVALVDIAAWLLGFVTMFITGLVTAASALLVLFALSLE